MKILFLSGEHAQVLGTGGVGAYVQTVTRALAALGHEVHVLSCLPGVGPTDEIVGSVHLHIRPYVRTWGLGRVLPGPLSRERVSMALSALHHARRLGTSFDVIEAPDWRAEGLLCALRGWPVVAQLHTPIGLLHELAGEAPTADSRVADRLERWAVARSGIVTSPSQLLVDRLRSTGWLRHRALRIVRLPVDLRSWEVQTRAASTPPSVVVVARLEPRKAPELVVDAAAILTRRGVPCRPTFVGRSAAMRDGLGYDEWLVERARAQGVEIDVMGVQPREDLPSLLATMSVACVPSTFESFSMALVEAMAASLPVVATRGVGAAEILAGPNREQVCDASPEALADALEPLLRDAALCRARGRANLALVQVESDPLDIARQRLEVFAEAIRSRPRQITARA